MLKDNEEIYTISKVVGNRQLTITVPKRDRNYFKKQVLVYNLDKTAKMIREVSYSASGNQKVVTIPKEEWANFKKGSKVFLYPFPKESIKVSTNKQGEPNEQIHTENNLQEMQ